MVGKGVALPALLLFLVAGCAPEQAQQEAETAQQAAAAIDSTPTVVLETTMGRIVMELDLAKAPKTVTNFLVHVNNGFYDSLIFHRVMPEFMVQAGLLTSGYERRLSPAAFLENEGGNGLLNVRGAVAMARGNDPHSAKTEFFINVKDNPQLNTTPETWGWAVFGRVIEGMDVVDRIRRVRTRERGTRENVPVDPIVMERVYVLTAEQEAARQTAAPGTQPGG